LCVGGKSIREDFDYFQEQSNLRLVTAGEKSSEKLQDFAANESPETDKLSAGVCHAQDGFLRPMVS
jgi:hypothetical protein